MAFLVCIALIALSTFLLLAFLRHKFQYFKQRNIDGPVPGFFGNTKDVYFKRKHFMDEMQNIYDNFKHKASCVGFFNFLSPYIIINSPELAKQIMIKDFKNFRNNEFCDLSNKKNDPVMALNPFVLKDDEWKEKRTEVAVGMTQNKLKAMFHLIDDVAKNFSAYIEREIKGNPGKCFNARDISGRFTCDSVTSYIFAIDGGGLTKSKSEIITMADKMVRSISDAAKSFLPKRLMPQDVQDFFVYIMEETIKHRHESGIERDDFLAHIISLRKKKGISDVEMAAHGVTFFLDGYDTTSVALTALFFELAKNQTVQNKLRDEIVNAVDENGRISYEKLLELPYLDQVMYESLRMNPPLTFSNRVCSEEIKIEGVKGHEVVIEKGMSVIIPILCFHHDPEFFHDPEAFIPERFNPELGGVKAFSDRGVLVPFGNGPRICLGMRFAQLQLKIAMFEIVKSFKITVDPIMDLSKKLEIDPDELLMNVKKGGIWLNFLKV